MSSHNRIAIVGAGVAGIALAIFASKQGSQVSLYERESKVSSMGAGVTLWPNAIFVLKQLGLEKELQCMGGMPRKMQQFNQHGKQQAEFDIGEVNAISGYSSVTILRRDLMGILAKALDDLSVAIHFNSPMNPADIDRLKQNYDLVVGADGRMNSVVRQALYGDKIDPCYQDFINIIGISQLKESALAHEIHDYRGLGERFGIVPVKSGGCYWAAGWATKIDKERPLSTWYKEMQQRFHTWPDPVQQVLKSYEPASLKHIFVHDIDPLPYWHQDNVIIIGDAAHAPLPTSGQGACQALEDAWHLARCLQKNDKLDTALTSFYQQRIGKTSATQRVGRQLAQKIFENSLAPQPADTGIDAKQLSAFWMQGLG